ncbi:DUF2971 domain-containing protein [Aeromonas caviae]|uniref:DUF2971 domain-containing protein n=1 Tax=Aeromonas caviae TaxID=648 RepID=UPI00191F2C5A|nr:DUF2971 domain-containing protein [Aeromonas caviae]MBL0540914.1 DUF2971 domain-containing protein [Aeromonas caviae]
MPIFYKYYSSLPPEYFENPTIKIASPLHLNDPFESLLPADIKEYIERFAEENEKKLEYSKEDVIKSLNNVMRAYGITSFSETQRNLLMWAHYANQHQGICIGYDTDIIFSNEQKKILREDGVINKVNYDSVRHEEFGNIKQINGFAEFIKYILMKIMLTKGNDWIYEKEHRYIINFSKSDHLKIKTDEVSANKALSSKINEMLADKALIKCEKRSVDDKVICYTPNKENNLGFGYLSFHEETSYFLEINPKSIKKIYFGFRTNNELVYKICESIMQNRNIYNGIYINRMQLDKKRFELRIPAETERMIQPDTP